MVWERGLRQSSAERALTLLALNDELMDGASLTAGSRDAALLRIRRRLFGDYIEGVVACPDCAEPLEVALSAASLLSREAAAATATSTSIECDGWRVAFRVPTGADLVALRCSSDVEHGLSTLMQRCVIDAERDGIPSDIDSISPAAADALNEALAAVDPGGDVTLVVGCPACGAENEAVFDSPSFVWHETQLLARGALLEVHDLACAYGWSEPEILALSPVRRRFYLEAIGA